MRDSHLFQNTNMRKGNVFYFEQPTRVFRIHNYYHTHVIALNSHLPLMQTLKRNSSNLG